jgi:hypothetical protein
MRTLRSFLQAPFILLVYVCLWTGRGCRWVVEFIDTIAGERE